MSKTMAVGAATLCLLLACGSALPAAAPRSATPSGAAAMRRTGRAVSVPISLVDGLPTVEASVNGRGPFRFAVDTGQPFALALTPAAAARMMLAKTGEVAIGDPAGDRAQSVSTFHIERLALGGLSFRGIEASGGAMARPHGETVDGTIGMALFRRMTLTLDYGRLALTADDRPRAGEAADGRSRAAPMSGAVRQFGPTPTAGGGRPCPGGNDP